MVANQNKDQSSKDRIVFVFARSQQQFAVACYCTRQIASKSIKQFKQGHKCDRRQTDDAEEKSVGKSRIACAAKKVVLHKFSQ